LGKGQYIEHIIGKKSINRACHLSHCSPVAEKSDHNHWHYYQISADQQNVKHIGSFSGTHQLIH